MWPAIVTAFVTLIVSAGTFYFTKWKERETSWLAKKLSYYEEFFSAASGILVERIPLEARIRYAAAVNNLHLIGSSEVIHALRAFTDDMILNRQNFSQDRHDKLWSRLVWEIRSDLKDPPTKHPEAFQAKLVGA